MQITGKTKVWLTNEWTKLDDVKSAKPDQGVNMMSYYNGSMEASGWVCVGEATITVTFADQKVITANQIAALKSELNETLARHEMEASAIKDRISKLTIIGYEATV